MILLTLLSFIFHFSTFAEPSSLFPVKEISSPYNSIDKDEQADLFFHSLFDRSLYMGSGTVLGSAALLSGIGWSLCQLYPCPTSIGNECLIAGYIFGVGAIHSFAQMFKTTPPLSFFFKKLPSPYSAWYLNKKMLSQIPTASQSDKELLYFLQRQWLSKATGCFPFHSKWMCPSFGIPIQVHPESTDSYARSPAFKFSQTYLTRVESWKQLLPQPKDFPLILTRPYDIRNYLPSYFEIQKGEKIESFMERLIKTSRSDLKLIVDLTSLLSSNNNQKMWEDAWRSYEEQILKLCKEHKLDLDQILCIERVQKENIGGIRLLPFFSATLENTEKQYRYLLDWISQFGLAATRIELDRLYSPHDVFAQEKPPAPIAIEFPGKEHCLSFLKKIENSWKSNHPQKNIMFKGTLEILKDLCLSLSEEKWEEVMRSPTLSSVVQLYLKKIKQELQLLIGQDETVSFNTTASCIEQIHADFSALLEIFAPFSAEDFRKIFQKHLTSIPTDLLPLTEYGIHSAGMTSLVGTFKATEKMLGRSLRVLYGENTYYECIQAAEQISQATHIQEAKEQDWKEVDLIITQFNPALKRINFEVSEYHVERIADILHKAIEAKNGSPLVVALDCTLDYSNSSKVNHLLAEFQKEIERGVLIIVCYRSGTKFDLFGMDNYCGSPFFMIRNKDPKWAYFDILTNDPALQTDHLSLNWFCLAFQNAAPYLELYRKQVFDNTRAVLNKIPSRLYNKDLHYRVIPMDDDTESSFIDVKVFGPFHEFKGGLLVGVLMTVKCMQGGHTLLYRRSLGFHHPNLAVLFSEKSTTIRLTLGLDPSQVDIIVECFEMIDFLNHSSKQILDYLQKNTPPKFKLFSPDSEPQNR